VNKLTVNNPEILEKRVGRLVKPGAPRVSIVVPVYNVAEYITETLDSALAQTFRDFEIIVVNDGSSDTVRLEKVLADYFDKIIYLRQANGGAAAARNAAISVARGSLLAFLDGDDIWFPEKLAVQTSFLQKNDFEMIYCDALLFGKPLYEGKTFMQGAPSKGKVTTESLLEGHCNVLTSGTIVSKELIIRYGLFDVKAVRVEDFELWFRLCKNAVKVGYQEKVLVKYRIRAGSLTGNNIEKAERGIAALELVKDKNDLSESEMRAWENQLTMLKAELSLERGKQNLVNKCFAEARRNFAEANVYRHNFKLQALMFLLAISPNLVLKLFKILRSAEFSYINPDNFPK
jgi:glycosyltransferase involved in cell wall biosynthesis